MMRSNRYGVAVSTATLIAAAGAAFGQGYSTGFEAPTYSGAAAGTLTTGQDGWYLPAVGGDDHKVYTYTGNTIGFVAHPGGGAQFNGGLATTNVARAQHDVAGFANGGIWTAEFDVNALWTGAPGLAVDNIGSFSLQDSNTTRYFQQLMNWGSNTAIIVPTGSTLTNYATTADKFHMPFGHFTTAVPSGAASITFECPSTFWMDLPVNHWYHVKVRWDFDAVNPRILSVSIKDLTAGTPEHTDDVSALSWFLQGGANSTFPLPTAVRLFAGGIGCATGWDNLTVQPAAAPSTCYANCDNSTNPPCLNVNDFVCFNNRYAASDSRANCDASTNPPILNVNDFVCFNNAYAAQCGAGGANNCGTNP
jgi:hypothetical protein